MTVWRGEKYIDLFGNLRSTVLLVFFAKGLVYLTCGTYSTAAFGTLCLSPKILRNPALLRLSNRSIYFLLRLPFFLFHNAYNVTNEQRSTAIEVTGRKTRRQSSMFAVLIFMSPMSLV